MSYFQDLIDLTSKLLKNAADEKLRDELSRIKSLVYSVQLEHSSVKTKCLDLESQIDDLKKDHLQEVSDLVSEMTRLNAGIDRLKQDCSVDLVKLNDLVEKYKKNMGLSTEAQPLGIVIG